MNFNDANALIDAAVNYFTGWNAQKSSYISQLAEKDKQIADRDSQIADLTTKLQTATNALQTDTTGFSAFHDKLTNLSALINGQATAAPQATSTSTNGTPGQPAAVGAAS